MQEKEKKMSMEKKLIIGVSGLCLLVMVIGVSYAYWATNVSQKSVNQITSDCLKLNIINESHTIRLDNAYPITDEEASLLEPYTFTLENTCNTVVDYNVNLEVMDAENRLSSEFIEFEVNNESHKKLNTYLVAKESYYTDEYQDHYTVAEKYEFAKGTLGAKQSTRYTIKLWMGQDVTLADDVMNKTFISKVTVTGALSKKDYSFDSLSVQETTPNSIKLNYQVSGNELDVVCHYGQVSGIYDQSCLNQTNNEWVLENLLPNTTYYYQVCINKNNEILECKSGSAKTLEESGLTETPTE